jgi:hypothetical protein
LELEAFSKPTQRPILLPLLHRVEERAGERRRVLIGYPSILSPLVPRGERKKRRA